MDIEEQNYIKLRDHLNTQPIGYRTTKSGAELRILKHLFTPEEAEIATCLSYKLESIETIFNKAGQLIQSAAELRIVLDRVAKKGAIEFEINDGERWYRNAPLVVGMFEYQLGKLTPAFLKDFNEYTSTRQFVTDFISADPPQMRTIPIGKSILVTHHVSHFDEVTSLLKQAEPPFVIFDCICRQKKALEGKACQVTQRKETCLGAGPFAQMGLEVGMGREISLEEALVIIEQNQREGLVLQPSNTKKVDFICSCCGCCCGILGIHKSVPKPAALWSSNFFAAIADDECDGCGVCVDRCQVRAIRLSPESGLCRINLNRCIGCGACVVSCPTEAITLEKKSEEKDPPSTREELLDLILDKKKRRKQDKSVNQEKT